MSNQENSFVGFEYLEVCAKRGMESMYVDSYHSFGWVYEGTSDPENGSGAVTLQFKRDRRLRSSAELTRLQRQFEACAHEIEALDRSRSTTAAIAALTIALAGTAFLGGAMLACLNGLLPLAILLAAPGLLGWIIPYFCYQKIWQRKTAQVAPLIEQKTDELHTACEQGYRLLTA